MKVLIVGYSVRYIACSASRAGHMVYAADSFCDLDLCSCVQDAVCMPRPLDVLQAEQLIRSYIEKFDPDAVVLGPGLEEASLKGIQVLNNLPEKTALVSDKLWLARWLENRGFPFIPTWNSLDNARFPAIVKPRKGAGGVGCKMIRNADELKFVEGMIIQDWMAGTPASVSVIGNGHESRAVAENEQLIGASWSGADEFRYSGNITPLYPPNSEIAEMAEEIVSELGLVGSNGIDFILTKRGPIVVEVNPRFQGSLDTVELSTGINVFQAHLKSFEGILPERQRSQRMAGRAIIYAEKNLTILEDLSRERIANRNCIGNGNWITDIPNPGSKIRKGDPITSVLVTGKSREEVKNLLIHRAAALRITVKSWDQMAI